MANLTSTASVTRTRSTRPLSNLNKSALNSTSLHARGITPGATTTSSSATTSAPAPSSAPIASAVSLSTVSNVSLFLTNLRLLNLDLHPDWPEINALTFSTKDLAQGQKKRIQCVEWALYHLFVLWDHDEARNKLQPFFPPTDQVRSLNLRAALLRSLEQAKKNGILGRDAVVRKTMLDECKGERLEEVLAVFSSAVLKKLVAEQSLNTPEHPALAQTLALENRGYSGERGELTALVLAHKVSLRRTLEEKNAARARFKEFSNTLTAKEEGIARRKEHALALKRQAKDDEVSDQLRRDVRRAVRNNWAGDERWMEALLHGDKDAQKDGVLSTPFDRVWRRVHSGRLAELEERSPGLLEQLDHRVKSQQERLQKWQGLQQRMFGKTPGSRSKEQEPQRKQRGIDFGFRAHETLHLGRLTSNKLATAKPSNFDHEYEKLISNLKAELASTSPGAHQIPSFFQRPPEADRISRGNNLDSESEEISDISDIEVPPAPPPRPSPPRRAPISLEPVLEPVLRVVQTYEHHPDMDLDSLPTTPSRLRRSATIQNHSPTPRNRVTLDSPTRTPGRRLSSPPKPKPDVHTPRAYSPPALASPDLPSEEEVCPPPSPTQLAADEILASVHAASPSPLKKPRHTLSLAERTKISMARRTSQANLRAAAEEEEEDDTTIHEPDPLTLKRNPVIVPIPASPTRDPPGSEGYEDLVTRTRRSMAGFEAARQKAQIERRRSLRRQPTTPANDGNRGRSYFGALDEDEEDDDGNYEGNTTLLIAEELLSQGKEDDYEAVFKSRPKIKTSPVGTPRKRLSGWDAF
ncbi:HAUS augmin-like complex subunit 6 N-terminus-domain-containing protein [Podospora australis]|uniref:HAUS augmin-like complex subunit 6 N-terminus-domain-containing protein n=1 Tax=Podospora australis TaxID=1536484 RepID=A0AAN6WIJ8_9PEZI|nr:HAUS augmin-like complex subunit 6 N-terminus-domain-containing protein [Podospora australis]